MRNEIERRPTIFAFVFFTLFVIIGIFYSRCDGNISSTSPTLWNQFKRRLFDQDVPEDPKSKTKEHDMTGI
jgi:hypothetical protein